MPSAAPHPNSPLFTCPSSLAPPHSPLLTRPSMSRAWQFGLCSVALTALALAAHADLAVSPVALAGKMLSAGAFQMVYLLPLASFPLELRASSFGVASSAGRLAAVVVPSLADKLSLETSSLLSAALAGAAALAVLCLISDSDGDSPGEGEGATEAAAVLEGRVVPSPTAPRAPAPRMCLEQQQQQQGRQGGAEGTGSSRSSSSSSSAPEPATERSPSSLAVEEQPVGFHPSVVCDRTLNPITGYRYTKIGSNPSYDLCQTEFDKLPQEEQTQFERIAPPVTPRRAALAAGVVALSALAFGQQQRSSPPRPPATPREDIEDLLELPPLSPAEELVALIFRPKIPATQRERPRWEYEY